MLFSIFLDFLKPGNGIIKETWYNVQELSLDAHHNEENYPESPDRIENMDNFNDTTNYEETRYKYIIVRYKGYFIPSETGNYR